MKKKIHEILRRIQKQLYKIAIPPTILIFTDYLVLSKFPAFRDLRISLGAKTLTYEKTTR